LIANAKQGAWRTGKSLKKGEREKKEGKKKK
jgi:hypothetical protein